MSRRAVGLLCAAAALAALSVPATAIAFYGNGAQIVSADFQRLEQGDDATVFAAISADGRYVAIQTRARNFFADDDPDPPGQYRAGGVFRFDLQTRALEKVADGDLFRESDNAFLRRGASNPSISADGRYVAFATAEPLLPADTNDNVDVYVRDMTIPIGSPGAYDLVSARDGGDTPASYGPPAVPFPGSNPGADVSRGVAISADGQKVAFRTDAPSDLPASATRRRARRPDLPARPRRRHDDAGHRQTRPGHRRDDRRARRRSARRGAQRRRDDRRLDRRQRARADALPRRREPRTRASSTTSGGASPTVPTPRPGGSPASPTPTTRTARRTRSPSSTRPRPGPATGR